MAAFRNFVASTTVGTVNTNVYSPGAGVTAHFERILLTNITAGTVQVTVRNTDTSAGVTRIMLNNTSIPAGQVVTLAKVTLEAGDILAVQSNTAASIDVTGSFLEMP